METKAIEEQRAEFLTHVTGLIDYWDKLPEIDEATGRKHTQRDRIEGVVFSLLVAIDGGSCGLSAYSLKKCFFNDEGEQIDEGPDLGGSLHELLHQFTGES